MARISTPFVTEASCFLCFKSCMTSNHQEDVGEEVAPAAGGFCDDLYLQIRLWSWWIWNSWWWQPRWALDEAADRESLRLGCCELTWPGDTAVHICTRTVAAKLGVEQRVESKVSAPLHPTSRGNDLVDVRSDEHSARECLPGSTKESLMTLRIWVEEGHVLWSSGDRAVLKYKPGSLAWIRSSLKDRQIDLELELLRCIN